LKQNVLPPEATQAGCLRHIRLHKLIHQNT
jgi:hypothetical protein